MDARLYRLAAAATLMDLLGKSAWDAGAIADAMNQEERAAVARAGRYPIQWQAKQRVMAVLQRHEARVAEEAMGRM